MATAINAKQTQHNNNEVVVMKGGHAMMTENTDLRIINAYSLCDDRCSGGVHNPDRARCDRCGGLIHVRVYEVIAPDGSEMTVGSECLRDILGYTPGPYHTRARAVADWLSGCFYVRPGCRILAFRGDGKIAHVETRDHRKLRYRVPHRLSLPLLRAGADLGFWTYPQVVRLTLDGRPFYHVVEWLGIGEKQGA